MVKAFIFDIGNVLLPFDFNIALRKLQEKCGALSPGETIKSPAEIVKPVVFAYESGAIGRAEFLEQARAVLQYTGTDEEFIAAWGDIFIENHAMLDLARSLHSRYPLFLLSNTSDLHIDYVFSRYPAFALFKDGVYSYRAKCFKPDRRIYETALSQFGIHAPETVFIDDLEPNVIAARELGFHAIRYDYNRHHDLVVALAELGVRA